MSLSRNTKVLIGGGLTAIGITVALVGYVVYSAYSFLNQQVGNFGEKEIPAELQEAKVFKGADFLTKNEFYKLERLTYSQVISRSLQIADENKRQQFISSQTARGIFGFDDLKICGGEIVAVGRFGGFVFDLSGNLKREIYFEPSERTIKIGWYEQKDNKVDLDNLSIIELAAHDKYGVLSRGYLEGVTIYDLNGKRIWNYGGEAVTDVGKMLNEKEYLDKKVYITGASAGDLDGDGAAEIIVSRRNDGIHAFDFNKTEKWFQPNEFPTADFRFVDINGDGNDELIEFQGVSSTVRDKATGNVIKKLEIDGWQKDFLVSEDAKKKKIAQLFYVDENKLFLSDLNNKTLLETEAPLSEIKIKPVKYNFPSPTPIDNKDGTYSKQISEFSKDTENVSDPKAVWVKLQKDKPKYLAVVASFIGIPRSNFYVYDEKGNLIYHELLPEDAETIAAISTANSNEEILIGGKDTIWKFTAK